MKRSITIALSLLTLLIIVTGCGNKQSQSKKMTIVGSTALQPLVEQVASEYSEKNQDISITVQGGGSGTGLSQVQTGAVLIGNSDVFASQADGIDADKLVDHEVAVVGIVPVVNPKIGVKNLTMQQLQDIFTGKITNWKSVGGKNEEIIVINRAHGSGTRITFEQSVLGKKTAVKSQEQDSNGTVQQIVGSTPGAISYVSFSYVNNKIQPLSIDGVKPNVTNVTTNAWKIWSYEHMYTRKNPGTEVDKFLKYIQSHEVQSKLVKQLGYISIHDMKVSKDANNHVSK